MRSMSGVGLGLSLVFVSLLLALVAELYYMLWWKKRVTTHTDIEDQDGTDNNNIFCWKKTSSLTSTTALNPQQQQQLGSSIKIRDTTHVEEDDDQDESEMMKMCGPPRFLFTIKEETREDLESEDGNLMMGGFETPFMTPLSSPPFMTPPSTPLMDGFNPLYESSSTDAVFNHRIRSSPPPKFKFLQDAEDKLYRKQLMQQQEK